MGGRFKSGPAPGPDASGYVEMRIAGTMMQVNWSRTGDHMTIVSPVGQFHAAKRDPIKGSDEDQARAMILELWEALRTGRRAT